MTWLFVLIGVAVLVFVVSKLSGESTDEALGNAGGAAFGCGSVMLQIFIAVLGFSIIIWIFKWLFT